MILCVTEKPSVGRDIAAILGATTRHEGYFEGNGYCVTWTFGHLCTLKEPHDYTPIWKRWTMSALPMIPERFGIKLLSNKGVEQQFNVIKHLIAEADEVINCGDAGQEGELIQRWVYQLAECRKPVKRLWISSLTDESIREGFQNLKDANEFTNLYHAGLSRAIGDWMLGLNATRLYTLKYGNGSSGSVLSIGRVQTPTLALIVNRHLEIENFKPENFWELTTIYRQVTFSCTKGRFNTEADGQIAIQAIADEPLRITDVSQKNGKEAPPRLFDLTSLQVECDKKFAFSAEQTLQLVQSLYEKKVTTYPRVDTTYLSTDLYPKIPGILQAMTPYAALTSPLQGQKLPKSKKVFDDTKVTDHHAIIPTNVPPQKANLTQDEKRVYDLIAKRFIAAFYPDCKVSTTTVMAQVAEYEFKATGKEILEDGWRVVYGKNSDPTDDKEPQQQMPTFIVGESGPHEPTLTTKTTQPPKPYTEGTLLRAMETAGRTVDDEQLREAMKENGIGRPSTRSAIIEMLFKRRYITKQRKSLAPTAAGIQLIGTIKDELLKSAKLTGIWENKLRRIERGELQPAQFMQELRQLVSDLVLTVMRDNASSGIIIGETEPEKKTKTEKPKKPRKPRITKLEQVVCPQCGTGHMLRGRTAYGCSRYTEGCTFVAPFNQFAADLTPAKLNRALDKLRKEN